MQWHIDLYLIRLDFGPEQVVDTIKSFFGFSISHETMYQYLLYDKKKADHYTNISTLCLKDGVNDTILMIPAVD